MLWFCLLLACANARWNKVPYRNTNPYNVWHSHRKSQVSQDIVRSNQIAVFSPLMNFDTDADPVSESRYRWIARVVHSRTSTIPHVCTASCISERIFVTAAACVSRLKVSYTTVIYQYDRIPVIAFVIPANGSRQGFDDIGFIVVDTDGPRNWDTILMFDTTNRTDNEFRWFSNIFDTDTIEHKVIGYSVPKVLSKISEIDKQYHLTELPVVVNLDLCPSILPFKETASAYRVPCYMSCALREFHAGKSVCKNYHGVEGGALFNIETNKLLGVATWGANSQALPVGFAVPNSENFFRNYACARRIRDNGEPLPLAGHYQSLCSN
ncbi:unnamed protein product, partial [Iphiclides podalirius]